METTTPNAHEPGIDALPGLADILLSGGVLALLALAPMAFVMMTSFTKFAVVFALLRSALGVQGVPPAMVLTSLSLLLTLVVMTPIFAQMNDLRIEHEASIDEPLDDPEHTLETIRDIAEPWRAFLQKNAGHAELTFFHDLLQDAPPSPSELDDTARDEDPPGLDTEAPLPWTVVVPAFALSELAAAFLLGFLLFLPFLLLDLLVGSILLSLGMHMLAPATVSLPFKLLLFVLTGGWLLLTESLLLSYQIPGAG